MLENVEVPIDYPLLAVRERRIFDGRLIQRIHYFITFGLAIGLVPLLMYLHLPLHFRWPEIFRPFIGCALQSVFALAIIFSIQYPRELLRIIQQKTAVHYLILAALLAFISWRVGGLNFDFAVSSMLAVIIPELIPYTSRTVLRRAIWAAVYFFLILLTIFAYGTIVPAIRDYNAYDPAFAQIDKILMLGHSIPEVSGRFLAASPGWVRNALELTYFGLFGLQGAVLLWQLKRESHMRMLGVLAIAYQITLLSYAVFPNLGPFSLEVAVRTPSIAMQHTLVTYLETLRVNKQVFSVGPLYFIGFPSMHIVQGIVTAAFLKPWRRLFRLAVIYNILLFVVIGLLGWHYLSDLLGGIIIAAVALKLMAKRPQLCSPL